MSQYKKRRRRFPFTPHTTLRPDYCSGGSFFGGHLGSCLLGTGPRLKAPESVRVSEWGRGQEGRIFLQNAECLGKHKFLQPNTLFLLASEAECLLGSSFRNLLLKSLTQVVTLFGKLVIREIVFTRMARDVSSRASNRLYL